MLASSLLVLIISAMISLCSCSSPYIPPDGIEFQLKNIADNKCLALPENFDDPVSDECVAIESYDDRWWTIIKNPETNYYLIQNTERNECLSADDQPYKLKTFECDINYSDQWWIMDGADDGFQIKNYKTNECIFMNTNNGPGTYKCKDDQGEANWDQLWIFYLETYQIVDIIFDTDNGKISNVQELISGSGECMNNITDMNGEESVEINSPGNMTETSSFSHTAGVSISVGTAFKTNVPIVADWFRWIRLGPSYDYEWGKETTISHQVGHPQNVTCRPGEIIIAECGAYTGTMDVPYRMILETTETKIRFESTGIWRGTYTFDPHCHLEYKNPI